MNKFMALGAVVCATLMIACASTDSKADEFAQQIVELSESGDVAGVETTMSEMLVYVEGLPVEERAAFVQRVAIALEAAEEKVEAALEQFEDKIEALAADGKLEEKVDSLVMKATKVIEQNITEERVQAAAKRVEEKMRENLSEEKVEAAAEKLEDKMKSAAEAFGLLFD